MHAFGKPLTIDEAPVPTPGYGEVLVKVNATGVCHTDLHAASGDWPVNPTLPFIPGHEGVGFVAAVGAGVKDLKEGDAVGVGWLHDACGHCEYCESGWETLCAEQHNSGYSVNGSLPNMRSALPTSWRQGSSHAGHHTIHTDRRGYFIRLSPPPR